jgi:hypothetical protein
VSDETIIPGLSLAPQVLNEDAATRARERIAGALSTVTGQRAEARQAYGNSVQDMMRAIDDTRSRLEEAHKNQWNLPLMAFGAGMLKGTPGVASNFLTELGGGLEAAVPAIARQRMSEMDFIQKVGELRRMRDEASGLPSKLDLASTEKERDRLLAQQQAVDTAELRAIPNAQRLAETQRKQEEALIKQRQDALTKLESETRNDVKEMVKNFEGVQPEDFEALTQTILHDRVRRYNDQPGLKNKIELPTLAQDVIERANKIRSGLERKGTDERQAKLGTEIEKRADAALKTRYPAFASLDSGQQELLKQKQIALLIEEHNRDKKPGESTYLMPKVILPEDWDKIGQAEKYHSRLVNIGEAPKEEVEAEHLPTDAIPKKYKNLSYPERQKMLAREEEKSKKELEPVTSMAESMPSRLKDAEILKANYDASNRTGLFGWVPTAGSEQAQILEKMIARLAFDNVPKGQGAITDPERQTLKEGNVRRMLQSGAFNTVLNLNKELGIRANEQLNFMQAWQSTHRTLDGALNAWNEYISSPQGSIMVVDKKTGAVNVNPRRMNWREYFDRKNKGDLGSGIDKWTRDPTTGQPVRVR